jgi:hypothetical protein
MSAVPSAKTRRAPTASFSLAPFAAVLLMNSFNSSAAL